MARRKKDPWEIPDTPPLLLIESKALFQRRRMLPFTAANMWKLCSMGFEVILFSVKKFFPDTLRKKFVKVWHTEYQVFEKDEIRELIRYREEIQYVFFDREEDVSVLAQKRGVHFKDWNGLFKKIED